ncbi:MAG: hypothetical protein ACYDDW_17670, partial [Dermatophilaceae bacterium]
ATAWPRPQLSATPLAPDAICNRFLPGPKFMKTVGPKDLTTLKGWIGRCNVGAALRLAINQNALTTRGRLQGINRLVDNRVQISRAPGERSV